MDASKTKWCNGCHSPQPPDGWKGFRCAKCAAKAKQGKGQWKFDAAGNVISKGKTKGAA